MSSHESAMQAARTLVANHHHASLATLSQKWEGHPFASSVAYVADLQGRPVMLLSGLAEHCQNLRADPRASVLISEQKSEHSAEQVARLTLMGRMSPVNLTEAEQQHFLHALPHMADYLQLGDFGFWRLEVEKIRLIAGFAAARWLSGSEYLRAETGLE